ncbi:MAG: GNAT family N-acetyltransferase [Burkholderiales bacterium]
MPQLVIRQTTAADVDTLVRLQAQVYPDIPGWKRDVLLGQIERFGAGQLTAVLNGRVVGCASSLVIAWDEWADEHSWDEITAAGTFDTHNPDGLTLYGAEVFVDPRLRGKRVGHALYQGRRRLCEKLNLKRIMACGRLPGYGKVADQMPIELYAKKVLWGDIADPVLGFQLREGFRFCGIMKHYIPEDDESHGNASLIVWLNPHYDPEQPTELQRASLQPATKTTP